MTDTAHAPPPIGYAEFRVASADYFRAAGIRLIAGRAFEDRDRADGDQVAIISAAAARATWGDADPIGKRIQYSNMDGDAHVLTIVGVAGRRARTASRPRAFGRGLRESRTATDHGLRVHARRALDAAARSARADRCAQSSTRKPRTSRMRSHRSPKCARPRSPIASSGSCCSVRSRRLRSRSRSAAFTGSWRFAVGQREHEFALRQALGATRERVARLVLGSGLAIGASGVAAGIALALAGSRLLGSQLYGVNAIDPLTLAGVSTLLLGTILLACIVPARHACAVAPREALH